MLKQTKKIRADLHFKKHPIYMPDSAILFKNPAVTLLE